MSKPSMSEPLARLKASLAQRYVIERELGQGGMATVYLARDVKHRRQVAVKVLHPEFAAAIGHERFLQEIEVVARLRHPHILPLHDSGDADGTLYYVMPYVEGESLQDRLTREKQLAIDEALHFAREIADALAYAHDHGVIHRDIKPANVMVEANHVVVTDFGVALVAHAVDSDRMTVGGLSPGTPEYMSPEQASGSPNIDARSDIYSLGCLLYEMLCGDPPFTGGRPQGILARKLIEPPRGLRTVRPTITPALEQVVLKALAITPADRYRSATEFVAALARAEAEAAGAMAPESPATVTAGPGATPTVSTAPALSRALAIGTLLLVSTLLLTAIGFLATVVYDVKLGIPSEFTPSRMDFPVIGIRALIPAVSIAFFVLVGYLVLEYIVRLLMFALRRVPTLGPRLEQWYRNATGAWHRVWLRAKPVSVAEFSFIAALLVSFAVLRRFWPLLASLWSAATEPLSLSFRPLHRGFTVALTVLITALVLIWRSLFRYLEARSAGGTRMRLSKWGGVAWIIILILIMTMPWRLLWDNEHPRALLRGEQVYILTERGSELLLYNPERKVTERYRRDEGPELQGQNTVGYVFEGPEVFAGNRPPR